MLAPNERLIYTSLKERGVKALSSSTQGTMSEGLLKPEELIAIVTLLAYPGNPQLAFWEKFKESNLL